MFATKKKLSVAAKDVARHDLFPTINKMCLIINTTRTPDGKIIMRFVAEGDKTGYVHSITLPENHSVRIIRTKK